CAASLLGALPHVVESPARHGYSRDVIPTLFGLDFHSSGCWRSPRLRWSPWLGSGCWPTLSRRLCRLVRRRGGCCLGRVWGSWLGGLLLGRILVPWLSGFAS